MSATTKHPTKAKGMNFTTANAYPPPSHPS